MLLPSSQLIQAESGSKEAESQLTRLIWGPGRARWSTAPTPSRNQVPRRPTRIPAPRNQMQKQKLSPYSLYEACGFSHLISQRLLPVLNLPYAYAVRPTRMENALRVCQAPHTNADLRVFCALQTAMRHGHRVSCPCSESLRACIWYSEAAYGKASYAYAAGTET
eukprot:3917501-Rhodomonas_salina.1